MKQAVKAALIEALREQRPLLHEIFSEVLEDYGLAEAIRKGRKTDLMTRDEVLGLLQGDA